MDARTVRQLGEVQVFLDAGENEIAGSIDGAVAAGTGVCKGDNPLHLWGVLLEQLDTHGNSAALAVARQHGVKCHAVQFQKFIPAGSLHQTDNLALVQRRPVAHDTMQLTVEEYAEVELRIIHDLAAVMVGLDERVCDAGGNHLHNNFFCTAHCLTTSYRPLPLWFSLVNVSVTAFWSYTYLIAARMSFACSS